RRVLFTIIFFCYAPPPPDTYTLSLHDALPILRLPEDRGREELPQCLESVERARRAVGSNRDARRAGVEPIAFVAEAGEGGVEAEDRKSTRLNSSHVSISYAVFCLKKKKKEEIE